MNVILFDDPVLWKNLLPLTYTRPISEIRIGILKIVEKWERYSWEKISYLTEDYLSVKYSPMVANDNILINSKFLPNPELAATIHKLELGAGIVFQNEVIAFRCGDLELENYLKSRKFDVEYSREYDGRIVKLSHLTDIFTYNGDEIRADFKVITEGRTSGPFSDTATAVYNPNNIFIEEGVKMKAAILNAEDGPIYLGKNAELQEGTMIRGPFSIGEGGVINMGGKMRPNTTVGPFCKVGGEVNNSILFGYSNKAHEGYIGNTVIGEWCNLGADTNTSNMKNNYSFVKIWNYEQEDYVSTGKQFCGSIIADHSKTGINTMLNTGTVVGVGSNIFGGGFPTKFVPSFAWGGAEGFAEFNLHKNFELAATVMKKYGHEFSSADKNILGHVFAMTKHHRSGFSK